MNRIAFYAPIKPPDHPIPSGDRLIAQNLLKVLDLAGYDAFLASRYIAYSKRHASDILAERKAGALAEVERLTAKMQSNPPDLWLTYHPYCKAPDWLGPNLSAHFDIPYVTLEAARTGQGRENGQDLWHDWRLEAQEGLRQADRHIVMKPSDRDYLHELFGSSEHLVQISPFADLALPDTAEPDGWPGHWRSDVPVIVTTGLMRPGKKVENYHILADALKPLQGLPWTLVLIGGGPEEQTIRQFFADFSADRLWWTGMIERQQVLSIMQKGDLFCWPGWREPIGMVYLEAQACGLPVVAMDSLGVPLVVAHGESGLLSKEYDRDQTPTGLTDAIATMVSHPKLRRDFADRASRRVNEHHSLDAAAQALRSALDPLLTAA